jgi:hypothetical protein
MPRVDLGKHELRDFSRTIELIELGRVFGARMLQSELTPTG